MHDSKPSSKHLLKIQDLKHQELNDLITRAKEFREMRKQGVRQLGEAPGKVVALVFEKPSLRTKVTFEVATVSLGAQPVFLSSDQILASGQNQHGRESIPDIGRNLERFCDLIVGRVYRHSSLEALASSVKIPIINALCNLHHPSQAIADAMTIESVFGEPKASIKVAYIGDGNNVATSLAQVCAARGFSVTVASPAGYEIPSLEQKVAKELALNSDQQINFIHDAKEAAKNADVIYADTFISMGQDAEREKRLEVFKSYQITEKLFAIAKPTAVFMHCLPAHRGEEVTNAVMDSSQSIVFDQAECKLYAAQAILEKYIKLESAQ